MMRRSLLSLLAWIAVSGCSSIMYTPVTVDSPIPEVVRQERIPVCSEALSEGLSCLALVRAENWFSDTGVRVGPGQSYCFQVPPGQAWFDAGRRNSPPQGEHGSTAMNWLAFAKRHEVPWFTLMAGVVLTTPVPLLKAAPTVLVDVQSKEFRVSLTAWDVYNVADQRHELTGGEVKSEAFVTSTKVSGALVMYPNDAWGPTGHPDWFYENNSGQIWVRITRVRPGEGCAVGA